MLRLFPRRAGLVSATLLALLFSSNTQNHIGWASAQYNNSNSGGDTSGSDYDCTFRGDPLDVKGDGSFLVRHIIHPVKQTVTVEVEYVGEAWIGIAFVTTDETSMVPNEAIIGLPDAGTVQKYELGGQSVSAVVPLTTRQTLTDTSIVQAGGTTTLKYTKAIAEDGEVAISANTAAQIMYAFGTGNTLDYHSFNNKGFIATIVTECLAVGETAAPIAPVAPVAPPPVAAPVAAPTPAATGGGGIAVVDLGQGRVQHTFSTLEFLSSLVLTTDSTAGTLTVDMSAPNIGWIAFAISRGDLLMPDSLAIMAFPDPTTGTATPQKYDLGSQKAESSVVLSPENRQTLIDATATQNDTHTTMKFTKLMVEGDEPQIVLQGDSFFLYALGPDNTFGYHQDRSSFQLDFSNVGSGIVAGSSPNWSLWQVHGIFMALAWAFLVPIGIACSVLRSLLPFPDGMWFQLHRFINMFGLVLTIAGFAIAVYLINDEGGKHFQTKKHHKIGLVVFIFAIIQALSGIFRPHLPPKPEKEAPHDDPEIVADDAGNTATQNKGTHSTEKSKARVIFEYQHRILGTVTVVLAWYNSNSGLDEFRNRFQSDDWTGLLWGIIAFIAVPTILLGVYQRTRQQQ